jgi:hypothetical protein
MGAAALLVAGMIVLLAFAGPGSPGIGLAPSAPGDSAAGSVPPGSAAAGAASLPGEPASQDGGSTTATPGAASAATRGPQSSLTAAPTAAPTAAATVAPTAVPPPPPTAAPTPATTPGPVGPCPVFPSSNVWNRDIAALPVAANSTTLITSIGLNANLHPDLSASGYGIPINVVGPSTPHVSVSFQYDDESDAGPYPIPASPLIEGGSDRHIILWDKSACMLYELFAATKSGGSWHAGSGAIWDLRSNALRPDGWTSADAAGLPILPGLVRYDEVAAGAIRHALRFTAPNTRTTHIYPARHDAGASGSPALPPMGLRVRLKASVDIGGFGPQSRVILEALKRYGMILADNGSPWYVTGAPDVHWDDDELHALGQLSGADFEVVDTSGLH